MPLSHEGKMIALLQLHVTVEPVALVNSIQIVQAADVVEDALDQAAFGV